MFRVTYAMVVVGDHATLKGAIKQLWEKVAEGIKNRTLNRMVLAETCWIEGEQPGGGSASWGPRPLLWERARDYAFDAGWVDSTVTGSVWN